MQNTEKLLVPATIVAILQETPCYMVHEQNTIQQGLNEMFTCYFKTFNHFDNCTPGQSETTTEHVINAYHLLSKLLTEASKHYTEINFD